MTRGSSPDSSSNSSVIRLQEVDSLNSHFIDFYIINMLQLSGAGCVWWSGGKSTRLLSDSTVILEHTALPASLKSRAVDSHGSAFIFTPGSGSGMKKYLNKNWKKCKESGTGTG